MRKIKDEELHNQEKIENDAPMYALNAKNTVETDASFDKKEIQKQANPQKWKGVLCILLSAFFFSLMSVFVKQSGDLPVFQKAFFRNAVAAVVSFILLLTSGSLKMKKGSLPGLLFRSIAGTVGIVCNFYAIDKMNISDANILNKLAPFFAIIFSVFILKEKTGVWEWIFVGVAFVGAVFVVKPSFDITDSIPALVGVLGGLGAGLAYTFVRYLKGRGERNTYIVFFFSVFSSLALLPIVIIQFQAMTVIQVVWLLLAGLMATGAQFSITAAYSFAPAKDISVYDYSQVLFSAVWGIIIFAEFPDYLSIIGYVIIIGAAILKYVTSRIFDKKAQK